MLATAIRRRTGQAIDYRLLGARHIHEIAEAIQPIPSTMTNTTDLPVAMDVLTTSLGVRISSSRLHGPEGLVNHYAFSSEKIPLNEKSAQALANLIVRLRHPNQASEIVQGRHHIFHVLVHS
jgi:hypothetical protein